MATYCWVLCPVSPSLLGKKGWGFESEIQFSILKKVFQSHHHVTCLVLFLRHPYSRSHKFRHSLCIYTRNTNSSITTYHKSQRLEWTLLSRKHLPPRSDKLQNSIIQIVTHVWQRLTFRHVNPFCGAPRLQPNGSNPDLLTVIRAGGRAIVRLPVRTLLGACLKAVNTKLFKVNLQPAPLTEANQCAINVRLVRLSSK